MTSEVLVDARWLEPPEPMERILLALDMLRPGEHLRFLIHREPVPLYSVLQNAGCTYEVKPGADGCYEVLIEPPRRRRAAWL